MFTRDIELQMPIATIVAGVIKRLGVPRLNAEMNVKTASGTITMVVVQTLILPDQAARVTRSEPYKGSSMFNSATRSRVEHQQTDVRIPLILQVSLSKLENVGTKIDQKVSFNIVLSLKLAVTSQRSVELQTLVSSVQGPDVVSPQDILAVKQTISEAVGPVAMATSGFAQLVPGGTPVAAGLGLTSDNDAIALRLTFRDVEDAATVAAEAAEWSEFYTSGAADIRGGLGFGMFVNEWMVVARVQAQIRAKLQDIATQIRNDYQAVGTTLRLNADPEVHWAEPSGLSVHVDGTLVDLCPAPFGYVDVQFTLDGWTTLSVPSMNVLRSQTVMKIDKNDWDMFRCGLANALSGAFIGAWIGALICALPGLIVGALFGALFGVGGTIAVSQVIDNKIEDDVITNDQRLTVVPFPNSEMLRFTETIGGLGGLGLGGDAPAAFPLQAAPQLEVTASGAWWTPTLLAPCRSHQLVQHSSVTLATSPGVSLLHAYVSASDDPLGQYAPYIRVQTYDGPGAADLDELSVLADGTTINIDLPQPLKPPFLANPYPCVLLVLTTAGARRIVIPAPGVLKGSEQEGLEAFYRPLCLALEPKIDPNKRIIKFQPEDPDWCPSVAKDRHRSDWWTVAAPNFRAGERVLFGSLDGTVAGQAVVDPNGLAQLEVMLDADHTAHGVGLWTEGNRALPQSLAGLSARRIRLVRGSHINVAAPVLGLCMFRARQALTAAVLTADYIETHIIQNPSAPLFHARLAVRSARGFMPFAGGLLTWGMQGIAHHRWMGGLSTVRTADCGNVHDVALSANGITALTDDGVVVFDDALNERVRIPRDGAGERLLPDGQQPPSASRSTSTRKIEQGGKGLSKAAAESSTFTGEEFTADARQAAPTTPGSFMHVRSPASVNIELDVKQRGGLPAARRDGVLARVVEDGENPGVELLVAWSMLDYMGGGNEGLVQIVQRQRRPHSERC